MELIVHLIPWDISPPNHRILNIQPKPTDTFQHIKDQLATRFNHSQILNFYVVWGGSVASNSALVSESGLKAGSTICIVPPSTFVKGASTDSLKVFQDLQYHHKPSSEQKNEDSSIHLFDIFTEDMLGSEAPWKPPRQEIDLLRWAVKVLHKNGCPSIKCPTVKWFGEYGCAMIARRTPFEESMLALVCLDNWSFHIHSTPRSRVHNSVPDDHQFPILFIGSVAIDQFEKYIHKVDRKLINVQQLVKEERTSATGSQGHHKTPGMIHAVMLDILKEFVKDSCVLEVDDKAVIPKGGFTDVGLHTGGHARKTSWHLVLGVVYHLLDAEEATGLFRWLLLQLPLRIAEHSVVTFLSEIRDPSSGLSRNSHACRQLTNSIMQTLCHIVKEVDSFAKTDLWEAEFAMFEARCIRVRYELHLAEEIRAKRIADQYLLPYISSKEVVVRNVKLLIPANTEVQQLESKGDILKTACSTLGLFPFPPSDEASWEQMENWMKKNCCSYKGDYVKQQVICNAVERFFFRKILTMSRVLPKTVERIIDQYRLVARELQTCQESLSLLRTELMSKELLVVWIAYCLVHQAAKVDHPDLARYSIPLHVDRMKFLVLTDVSAIDAARQVYRYIHANVKSHGPIFSLLSSDKTFEFASKRGNEMTRIESMRVSENSGMRARQEKRWHQIQEKKQNLETLDKELEELQEEYRRVSCEKERLHREWWDEHLATRAGVKKPQVLRDTQRQENNLSGDIDRKEAEIRREERAPSPIFQPLPSEKDLATKVLFFLTLPSDLQTLSRLSFTAQQMLLPREKTIKMDTSPRVAGMTEFEIDSEVSTTQPGTVWYDYYGSESTGRIHGSSVAPNAVVLGSSAAIPEGQKWYSSNVRSISSASDGVWYPDSLKLKLFWNGGGCKLDNRSQGKYFNPFKKVSALITVYNFTENPYVTDGSSGSLEWAFFQTGEDTSHKRGNFALASQDKMVRWLSSKNAFIDFCSMRAYPLQQMRRLCATLLSRCLPLMNKQVRILMQQTVHQLGDLTPSDGDSKRDWHTDLNCFDGWEALRTILHEICEELRSKSREHPSIFTVGELSAQASQWDPECRIVARKLASIAEKAADDLAEEETNASCKEVSTFRARRCILYMSCLICHSHGSLLRNDVAQMCKAVVMADYTRLFEDPNPYDNEVRNLTAITTQVMVSRMPEVLKEVLATPQILSDTVCHVHEAASHEISWKFINVAKESVATSCVGNGADNHQYFIDLNTGTFLVDGRPPSKLPRPICSSPLYIRTFQDRNFEVVRKSSGILITTRAIGGRLYEFSMHTDRVLVKEVDLSHPNSPLELMDAYELDSWGSDLPKRLKEMYSHWLCRITNTIFLRPKYFLERRVHYVLVPKDHGSVHAGSSVGEGDSMSTSGKNWICFRIPEHLQTKDWLVEHCDLTTLDKLVYFADETSNRLLKVLGKFERTEGCILSFQTAQNSLLVLLPRFGLEFELSEEGWVKSNSFSSFKLSDRQNFEDTLLDFSEYLILESEGAKKVLIPAGRVCKKSKSVSVSSSDAINAVRRFHVYSIHPRFKTLDPVPGKDSIEARLQLAALYTATGSLLPEKRTRQTGGEYAIELMRQSWQNSPMSETETGHLKSICSYGQLYPTLSLLAFELFSSSQVLHFLPFSTSKVSEGIPLNIVVSTEYGLLKGRGQLSPRTMLTQDEEMYVLSAVTTRSTRNNNQQERDNVVHGISASSIMWEIRKLLKNMLTTQEDARGIPEFPFENSAFGDTSIGAKISIDLKESWKEFFKLQTMKFSYAAFEEVVEHINACLIRCRASRTLIETELHISLGRTHGNRLEVSCFNIRKAANLEPQKTQRDLLKISCRIVSPELFNPFLTPNSCEVVRNMILEWMQLCVMEDKLCRILKLVKCKNSAEVIRELQEVDRSWDVTEHPSWLAFEVEEQLQIRELQYQVADFCLRNPGKITQLNMGEGKTRVIVPMLVLKLAERKHLMRIHFLSPLLSEAYDFLHQTLTAGVSNLRLLKLPFHRDVKLDPSQAKRILQCLRRCQDNGAALVVAPEHRLSLLLKKSELDIQDNFSAIATAQALQSIYDVPFFDLFDESDELLHHRYQLIYAAGPCIPLSSGKVRFVASQAVLYQLQNNEEVANVLQVVATRDKFDGRLPGAMDNIRLLQDVSDKQEQILVRKLAMAICSDPPYHLRWLKGNGSLQAMIAFATEKDKHLEWLHSQVPGLSDEQKEGLLALRGILAYGLLRHCISLRYRVDYGIDDRRQNRRVAVPYRGSDMPSDRAEYAHPDVLILFTHLAYYYRGLSVREVTEAVQSLLSLGPIAQQEEYKQWFRNASYVIEERRRLIDDVDKLDISNAGQMALMHEVYRFNMDMISFWLDACVLPKETMLFPQRLTANSFHLTDNKDGNIIGFSGTKDNSILLPVQVKQELPDIPQVQATDGKMLHLMLKNPVVHCLPASVSLFEPVLHMCVEKKVSALIDAGALMAGLENEQVAKQMVSLIQSMDENQHQGVVFFEKKEASWMALGLDGRQRPLGSAPIQERDAFVYFDETHCRGADMKLKETASALLTVGPDMCKDKIMQAAGRMRKLDRGQSLIFAVPTEIAMKIPTTDGCPLTSKKLLQWVVGNTVKATAKGLVSWGSQGSLYCTTKDTETKMTGEVLELEELYGSEVLMSPISEIVKRTQSSCRQHVRAAGKTTDETGEKMMGSIMQRALEYGSDQLLVMSQADEECEREIEHERELEREREVMIPRKEPGCQFSWDFDALLCKTEAADVLQLTGAVSISEAMDGIFQSLNVKGIVWKKCMVFLTRNFMNTVEEEDGSKVQNYSNYLRPVDTVIFFSEGRCCLLLSEWEADKVLRRVWKLCEGGNEKHMGITYTNFAFLFRSEGSRSDGKCLFSIPRSSVAQHGVLERASEYTIAGLQLFGGLTMFPGDGRKTALREMLVSDEAKRSALRLVTMRGGEHMIARSDLEDMCSINE